MKGNKKISKRKSAADDSDNSFSESENDKNFE